MVNLPSDSIGGCQCGRVRYTASLASTDAYLCHCRMCQRATGNVSIAFVNVAQADLTWETAPDWYASSPIARRAFCSACGTPLGFEYLDSDKCDLTVGSFDNPAPFTCTSHFGVESRLEHWRDTDGLPETRSDTYAPLVTRWSAVAKQP